MRQYKVGTPLRAQSGAGLVTAGVHPLQVTPPLNATSHLAKHQRLDPLVNEPCHNAVWINDHDIFFKGHTEEHQAHDLGYGTTIRIRSLGKTPKKDVDELGIEPRTFRMRRTC